MIFVMGWLASIAARAAGCSPSEILLVIDHRAQIKYVRRSHREAEVTSTALVPASHNNVTLMRYEGGRPKFETVDWTTYRTRDIGMWTILYDSTMYVKVESTRQGYIVHFFFGDTARLLTNRARQEEIELIEQKRGQYVQLPANLQRRLPERKRLTAR